MEARGLEGQCPIGRGCFFRRSDFRHWRFWYDHRWVLSSGGRDPLFWTLHLNKLHRAVRWLAACSARVSAVVQCPDSLGPQNCETPVQDQAPSFVFKLVEQRAPSFDFSLIVNKFSSAHPPHPCLSARLKGSSRCMWLRARVFYFWRNKAGGIAGRLRQRPGEGWKGRFRGSGQRD